VTPVEDGLVVDAATQGPTLIQNQIAATTGLKTSAIVVNSRRSGGGFGAKSSTPTAPAAMAAVAALEFNLPVRVLMNLKTPMKGYGARPVYRADYKVGAKKDGTLTALDITIYLAVGYAWADSGFEAGVVIANIDNAYNIPNMTSRAVMLRSHTPPCTSMRGPGWIQSITFSELIMNNLAQKMQMNPTTLRAKNFFVDGGVTGNSMKIANCTIETMWAQMQATDTWKNVATDVVAFNKASKFIKRGVAMTPCRFAVGWGMVYNSLITVYADGCICVTHGGCEIGQGINTKVAQAVCYKLGLKDSEGGVPPTIRILPTTTAIAGGMLNLTGGSITSELCVLSAMNACDALLARLKPFHGDGVTWEEAVGLASAANVNLSASGWTDIPPNFADRYNSWSATVAEVEVDTLTGQFEILRSELVLDCGISMNPAIDIGQLEGGFMMGVGWFTQEEVAWNAQTGEAEFASSWKYKIPGAYDVPVVFNANLLENTANPSGVLSSKAVGEPPVAMSMAVVHAIENAINFSRADNGLGSFVVQNLPLTVPLIADACAVDASMYTLS
jgi:xanthine dehydrogenase/oxidase